jgi:hypothetical protein
MLHSVRSSSSHSTPRKNLDHCVAIDRRNTGEGGRKDENLGFKPNHGLAGFAPVLDYPQDGAGNETLFGALDQKAINTQNISLDVRQPKLDFLDGSVGKPKLPFSVSVLAHRIPYQNVLFQ